MESGAQLHQRGDLAAHFDGPFFRSGEAAHQAEQRALSGPISPHDGDILSRGDAEGNVLQRVKIVLWIASKPIPHVMPHELLAGVPVEDL